MRNELLAVAKQERVKIETTVGTVYVAAPTVKVKSEILSKSGAIGGKLDVGKMSVLSVIACAEDEDGNKIFQASDLEALLQLPAGSWLEAVAAAAHRQMTPDQDAVLENLGVTASDS